MVIRLRQKSADSPFRKVCISGGLVFPPAGYHYRCIVTVWSYFELPKPIIAQIVIDMIKYSCFCFYHLTTDASYYDLFDVSLNLGDKMQLSTFGYQLS